MMRIMVIEHYYDDQGWSSLTSPPPHSSGEPPVWPSSSRSPPPRPPSPSSSSPNPAAPSHASKLSLSGTSVHFRSPPVSWQVPFFPSPVSPAPLSILSDFQRCFSIQNLSLRSHQVDQSVSQPGQVYSTQAGLQMKARLLQVRQSKEVKEALERPPPQRVRQREQRIQLRTGYGAQCQLCALLRQVHSLTAEERVQLLKADQPSQIQWCPAY